MICVQYIFPSGLAVDGVWACALEDGVCVQCEFRVEHHVGWGAIIIIKVKELMIRRQASVSYFLIFQFRRTLS